MNLLIFINQKNYYEEILIQVIFTIQAVTKLDLFIDSLYSIIINCIFILAFIVFAIYFKTARIFRVWYHHHIILLQPILLQNQSNNIESLINIIIIITLSSLFLAYTQIIDEIQVYTFRKVLKLAILYTAFAIHFSVDNYYIYLMLTYDIYVILQTFIAGIPSSQNLDKFQTLTLISINRIAAIIILYFGTYWELLLIFPLIVCLSIKGFQVFLHLQIRNAITRSHLSLKDIMFIYMTYQIGLYVGLFYLSQILVTHSKDCSKPHCFCTSNFELLQQQTWKSEAACLQRSINQIMCEIIRLYDFSEFEDSQEYLLFLSRIETEYREDRLFETLTRSRKLNSQTCYGFKIFPNQLRIEGHRRLFYSKLLEKVEGVKINSFIYFTYCNLVEQLGQLVIKLLQQRQEIFFMLTIQYQNPLYYLLHSKLTIYFKHVTRCEHLIKKILILNSQSVVSQHLLYAVYSMITCQPEKCKGMKNPLANSQQEPLWTILNDRQCCYVQCKYDKGLVMLNHSVLFTTIIEESGIKSEYVGQYIDKLIAGPAQEIHQRFLLRLIDEGKPRLLNNGIQKFFINTNKGFMKQIDSLVRLGQSMDNLTFMTIMGYKQEDSCGKILLHSQGMMYSYCEMAANMLKFDYIRHKNNISKLTLNLKMCIPMNDLEEVQHNFILIPKFNSQDHDSQKKSVSTNPKSQITFYKYFLKHPKQCFIHISTYKFSKSSYDEGKCEFETLYLYTCTPILDLEYKMMALEIMLQQAMISLKIDSDSYVTSYTTFKSIVPSNMIKQSVSISQQELDDVNFQLSEESCHIVQDPQTIFISPFMNPEQNETYIEQSREQKLQNNYSSIIANSFVTQDLLFSSRRGQEDLSGRYTARENQQLIQQKIDHLEFSPHKQPLDQEEEIESPIETQNLKEMKVTIKEETLQNISEQFEWIKSQMKQQKHQTIKPFNQKVTTKPHIRKTKLTLDRQPSSVKSSDSQKGLLNHIVNGMIQSSPHQFYSLLIVAVFYVVCLIIVIVLSLQQSEENIKQYYLESKGGQFSISLLQNINLMVISLEILSIQRNFNMLKFYVKQSAQDYVSYCQSINYKQNINYDFLKNLEDTTLTIRRSFQNDLITIQSTKITGRHFLIDIFAYIFLANDEIVDQNQEINTMGLQESYFMLNYEMFFNLSNSMLHDVDQKMQIQYEKFLQITTIYIVSGLCSCFIVVIGIFTAQMQIIKWRASIVRTYFLFQNLQYYITEQENDTSILLQIDELKHMKIGFIKKDKDTAQRLKMDQRFQDNRLKSQFWAKQFILIICLVTLELAYFIPFQLLSKSNIDQLANFHLQVNQLGLSQLAFSNRLTYFVQSYGNSDNNLDESIFQVSDEILSHYENDFLYQIPYETETSSQITNLVNGNICELTIFNLSDYGYTCPYLLEDGYQKFVVSANNQFIQLKSEYPKYKGINQIVQDSDFREIIISYGYIFPIFIKNREDLYTYQSYQNIKNSDQSILMTISALIVIILAFGILIYAILQQCYLMIMTVKKALLIFSKQCLARNKHLIQILSKEVIIE